MSPVIPDLILTFEGALIDKKNIRENQLGHLRFSSSQGKEYKIFKDWK